MRFAQKCRNRLELRLLTPTHHLQALWFPTDCCLRANKRMHTQLYSWAEFIEFHCLWARGPLLTQARPRPRYSVSRCTTWKHEDIKRGEDANSRLQRGLTAFMLANPGEVVRATQKTPNNLPKRLSLGRPDKNTYAWRYELKLVVSTPKGSTTASGDVRAARSCEREVGLNPCRYANIYLHTHVGSRKVLVVLL